MFHSLSLQLVPTSKEMSSKDVSSTESECIVQNKVSNNIVWHLTLQPGAKKQLAFEYSVSWPSDKTLSSYDYQEEEHLLF